MFSLRRELRKLILAMNPFLRWFCHNLLLLWLLCCWFLLVIGVVCVSAISIHIRILRLRISVGLIPLTIAIVASISTSPLVEILLRLEAYMHQLQLIGGKESKVISERLSEVVCWKDCGPKKATHSALQSTYLAEVPRPPQQMI
jgi:hypothetical protein